MKMNILNRYDCRDKDFLGKTKTRMTTSTETQLKTI